MKTATTIPQCIDYIYLRMYQSLSDVHVTDGQPPPPEDAEPLLLCIGFTGQLGEPSVENSRNRQQADTKPDRETYEVTCIASAWLGSDTSAKQVRDAAFGIVNSVGDFLAKDQTLGGLVMRSRLLTDALAQEQTTMGAVATVRFVIQIDAFTR